MQQEQRNLLTITLTTDSQTNRKKIAAF